MSAQETALAMYELGVKWNEFGLDDAAFIEAMQAVLNTPQEVTYEEFLRRVNA